MLVIKTEAIRASATSPAACPYSSFTRLKWSTSTRATGYGTFGEFADIFSTSINRRRFGTWISTSVRASAAGWPA